MAERVEPLDLGVTWEPNAPSAVLVCNDEGLAVLALRAYFNDPDTRCVVVVWQGVRFSSLSDTNDEAVSGHRLYGSGLSEVRWAGHVQGSEIVAALERQNRVHPHHQASRFNELHHHILLTKECVAEVVAEGVRVRRVEGTTLYAATTAARSRRAPDSRH